MTVLMISPTLMLVTDRQRASELRRRGHNVVFARKPIYSSGVLPLDHLAEPLLN